MLRAGLGGAVRDTRAAVPVSCGCALEAYGGAGRLSRDNVETASPDLHRHSPSLPAMGFSKLSWFTVDAVR